MEIKTSASSNGISYVFAPTSSGWHTLKGTYVVKETDIDYDFHLRFWSNAPDTTVCFTDI
jgi:hypothetical protein